MVVSMDHNLIRPEADALIHRSPTLAPPEPNPPFVFPMQSERSDTSSSRARAASSVDLSGGRRPANRSRPQRLSLNHNLANPLPAFDFNPSASSSSATTPDSPKRSPNRNRPSSTQPGGHRRNGSEYIGGDIKAGGPGLMSTSPAKGEGALPTLQPSHAGPPNSRRGHAHRRSGAVSSHDLSMILKPAGDHRGSCSAPTTPADPLTQRSFPPTFDRSISQPTLASQGLDNPTRNQNGTSVDDQRRRVGFAETVEYIPRRLSTMSFETSSSLSTARANHSVTGSITSIVSAGASSPPSMIGRAQFDAPPEYDITRPRPKTAGPTMRGFQQKITSNQDTLMSKRPSSASATTDRPIEIVTPSALPDWKFPFPNSEGPDEPCSESMISPADALTSPQPLPLENLIPRRPRRRSVNPANSSGTRLRTSPEPKISKRQRKVKSWAGSILSRKARIRDLKGNVISNRSPLSPSDTFALESEFSLENVNFDEDTTCVIESPVVEGQKPPGVQTNFSTWKPREQTPSPDSDSIQMLDLDAALGPYSNDDPIDGGFSIARRRMHSSGTTGGFSGPGMHYHRRAESAPEMAAINHHIFGFPRLGSNPTMADVFEEEEGEEVEEEQQVVEEEDEDKNVRSQEEATTKSICQDKAHEDKGDLGLGVEIVDVDDSHDILMRRRTRHGFMVDSGGDCRPPITQEHSASSVKSMGIPEDISPLEIVGAEEEPRFSMITKSSDESTITPTLSHDPFANRPVSAPIDFALPKPNLSLATPETYSSAVSSPDFNRSSFDIPRLHTAHSSITDRATLSSSRAGDPFVGAHASVEDVPSLASSASTMMSAQPHRFSGSAYACSSAERSASLSAAVPPRSRPATDYKRSSLASLSRLVGSSYGEKSMLPIEDRVQPDNAKKKEKKKGNRISRLMRFWKSKEKLAPS